MYAHNVPKRLARALAPRFAAGVVVTLALLSAACSNDSASRINAPPLLSSSSHGQSAENDHRGDGRDGRGGVSNFAVLANAAVTCTRVSIIGDVGTFLAPPTGKFNPTLCDVTGTVHLGDAAAKQAFRDFLRTYAALAPAPGYCNVTNTITGTLADARFSPGVYCISSEEKTGVLTLTGNGEWTFLVADGALTATNFSVVMANGGDPCNVTWWVDAAATIVDSDANSIHPFLGTILAGAAISFTGGADANRIPFTGNAWAGAAGVGDVTMTDTNLTGCEGRKGNGKDKDKCNQGVGNGPERCDPGKSNHGDDDNSNDENGGTPGHPGRQGGHH